jgi:hypothetical protein
MSTLNYIIDKIINIKNNIFSPNYDKNDNINLILKTLFSTLIEYNNKHFNIHNTRNKYKFYQEIMETPFLVNYKNDFIDSFYKIQKVYNAFNRLCYIYKYNKTKIIVTTDMCLNDIYLYDKNIICIYQRNSKYLFHINDIIKIINMSLTNSYMFFANPVSIKNPYNNLPFSKSILYNIYFFMKYKTFYNSELFTKFFECNFNLTIFLRKNEFLLREYTIYNFVHKSPSNILMQEIQNMLNDFNFYCFEIKLKNKIKIDSNFPQDRLIKIMKPYLLLYVSSMYSFTENKKRENKALLQNKLLAFNNYNPLFGRKKLKININKTFDNKIEVCGKTYEYDDRHIKFNNNINEINHFFINHLDYQEGLTYDYAFNNILNSNNSFYIIYNNNNDVNRLNFQNEDTEEDENENVGEDEDTEEDEDEDLEEYDNTEEDDREDGEDEETIEYNEQDSIS